VGDAYSGRAFVEMRISAPFEPEYAQRALRTRRTPGQAGARIIARKKKCEALGARTEQAGRET